MQRLVQKLPLPREQCGDVEKQEHSATQQEITNKRREFLQLLFQVKPGDLADFSGIDSYCDYLEHGVFQPLTGSSFAPIWPLISRPNPKRTADCWDWSLAVLQVLQSEVSEVPDVSDVSEVSLHDILQLLAGQRGNSDFKQSVGSGRDKGYLYVAIFGVLCWSSLVVRPQLTFADDAVPNPTCLPPHGIRSTSSDTVRRASDKSMRPMLTTFRPFRLQYWDGQLHDTRGEVVEADSLNLYAAGLSMYSLRYFGHVTIQWVDTISEHLRFNPANRRLSLFRFPTFCALLAIHGDNMCSSIRSIIEQFDPLTPEERDQCCVSLAQEVILSYRLLFGQDAKSRKLAREELAKLRTSCTDQNQRLDAMLPALCERQYEHGRLWWKAFDKVLHGYLAEIWPITCRTMDGHLQQCDVYSAQDDFPRFGRRLLRLQQFNARQRPSRLTDLWRDRRNPLQWYTFWAVVIVGGLANVLATLQLVVSIVEVQASLRSG